MENKKKSSRISSATAIGLHGLIEEMDLQVPAPFLRSEAIAGIRRTHESPDGIAEQYPMSYAPKDLWGHLRFAMRYEPVDLGVLAAFFRAADRAHFASWVRSETTGIFARRAWYLFELLTGETLDVPDVPPTGYAPLLNPETHIASSGIYVPRQKIVDNLLGNRDYCPLIRRTANLDGWMAQDFAQIFQSVISGVTPSVLERAVQYLFTKETQSSFAIEGETPTPDRARRFVQALENAGDFDTSRKEDFVALQRTIVDARFALEDWRTAQNYVGSVAPDYSPIVHYVSPQPGDLSELMNGWMRSVARIEAGAVNSVCVATIAGFGFVFLHPFEDGNGRLHRFLIHHSLAKLGFTPPGVLFPVSAAMLRNRRVYDQALEFYSRKITPFIDYFVDDAGRMIVSGETAALYRYPDLTLQAEYLYRVVADTLNTDIPAEVGFLQRYDRAMTAIREVIDLPGTRASLLVRLILQNRGKLSKAKRGQFSELKDEEIEAIEAALAIDKTEEPQ